MDSNPEGLATVVVEAAFHMLLDLPAGLLIDSTWNVQARRETYRQQSSETFAP